MRSSMKAVGVWLLILLLSLMFLACSGGGSGSGGGTSSTTTSLQVADKVSVVDATLSGSVATGAAPLKAGFFAARAASFSATSDYNTDKTNVYVQERSAEQFDNINNILCMMGQSKYDAMLNKGDYVALVDKNQCDSNKSDASSAGQSSQQSQSSSANMPSYMKFTVNSSRVDNNSPEIVKVWIHQEKSDHDQPALIYAYIKIDEGKSDTNPYGIFTLDFAGFPIVNGVVASTAAFKGTLRAIRSVASDPTSKVLLQFVQNDSHMDGGCNGVVNTLSQITLDRSPDGSGGAGHVKENYVGGTCSGGSEFDLAFNSADFFRKDLVTAGSPSVCLDRINFKESSWSYGLYDVNGARVHRDSGFPINYTFGGKTYNGWIGYWGLWIDNSAPAIADGATVNQVDYNGGSGTSIPYTVFKSGGKLKKHTRKTLTLGEIKNLPLGYNEYSQGTNTNYQVSFDGTNFNKIAYMPQCTGNCTWKNIAPDVNGKYPTIDLTQLPWGNLNFWSQNGGGQYQVQLASCGTPTCGMNGCVTACSLPALTASAVIFYAEDLVYPGDATVPTSLTCYDNCPTVVSGQATMPNMMSGPSNTPTTYTFDPAALMLKDQGSASVISNVTDSMQPWGIMTGPLFAASDVTLLACPWDAGQTCSWLAGSILPIYYTWETGPNNWNQFIAIKDATNAIKKFDPPLQVKYVDANGTTFLLDYSGFGQLNGIPGKCVDMDSGADADCSLSGNGNNSIRWVPQFTIPGLTLVTATDPATNAATDCYVKPLQVEQRMMPDATAGACSTLAGTDFSAYTLPDTSLWSDPTTAEGVEPVVTAAPAVIGGVVQ